MTSSPAKSEPVDLRRDSARPLYEQIAMAIEADIAQGRLGPRARLASESALMRRFGVSRITVRGAISRLVRLGVVETRQGKGTFVAPRIVRHGLDRLTGFYDEMLSQGLRPSRELVDFREALPGETAGTPFAGRKPGPLLLRRRYLLDGEPFAFVHGLLVAEARRVSRKAAASHTIYELIASLRFEVERADVGIRARAPGRDVALRLGVPQRRHVLVMERSSYGAGGVPLEHSCFYIRPEAYEFRLSVMGPVTISSGIRRLEATVPAGSSSAAFPD